MSNLEENVNFAEFDKEEEILLMAQEGLSTQVKRRCDFLILDVIIT